MGCKGSLSLLLFLGCSSISEAEARRQFDESVASSNSCTQDDDCVLATAGCPLGCWAAVRRDQKEVIEQRAREIISDYSGSGRDCVYKCQTPHLSCFAGRCSTEAHD
jgi:hypothetical protein